MDRDRGMRECAGIEDDGLRAARLRLLDPVDEVPFVLPDEQVTTAVDGVAHIRSKLAAMRAHATQISADGPFFALASVAGDEAWGVEYYRLVRGEPGPTGPDGREDDLFAGVV